MSVAGAAVATVVSQYAAFAWILHRLVSKKALRLGDLRKVPSPLEMYKILREGIPIALRGVVFIGMFSLASVFVAKRGPAVHAAFEICRVTSTWIYMLALTMEQTVAALVSIAVGREAMREAKDITIRTMQVRYLASVWLSLLASDRISRVWSCSYAVGVVQIAICESVREKCRRRGYVLQGGSDCSVSNGNIE